MKTPRYPRIPPHAPNWRQALGAAAARLDEGFSQSGTRSPLASAALEEEFAALLCAYGALDEEIDRMRARASLVT